jgi:YHS domain-containing protein
MMRRFMLLGGVVLTLGLCETAWGAQSLYPYPCATPCTPNTVGFGYFPTRWRQWPGEERLPQTNPKAFGSEVIPAPEGQEPVAPPVATPGQGPSAAPGGEILPPSGAILPPQELPTEPKSATPSKPATEGGLQGLPPESGIVPPPALPGGGKLKPESKPKTQPKSSKGGTLSDATDRAPLEIQPGGTNQPKTQPQPSTGGMLSDATDQAPLEIQPGGTNQLKTQPQPSTGGTLSDATDQAPLEIQPRGTNQVAAADGPVADERQVQPGTVISLVDPQNPRRGYVALSTHSADSIGTTAPAWSSQEIETAAYASVEPAAPTAAGNPKSAPPAVAMNGYCPVELVRNGRWMVGDLRWTVVHDGRIYRLAGPAQRREFQANPKAFTPAYSGNDPVLTVDQRRTVPGQLTYCATYNGRLYVFASAATQLQFDKEPQRYVVEK